MLNAEAVRRALGDAFHVMAPQPGVVDVALLDEAGQVLCKAQLRDHSHVIAVRDLETIEDRRGQGLGTRMLDAIAGWADGAGCSLTIRARHGDHRDPDHDRRLAKWIAARGYLSAGGITMVRRPGGWPT